jgi:hypothetical protein
MITTVDQTAFNLAVATLLGACIGSSSSLAITKIQCSFRPSASVAVQKSAFFTLRVRYEPRPH